MRTESEAQLQKAVQHPNQRQAYLNTFMPIPHCSGIHYARTIDEIIEHQTPWLESIGISDELADKINRQTGSIFPQATAYVPLISTLIGTIEQSPIFVRPPLFNQEYSHEEIEHIITAHEARHLFQHAHGLFGLDNIKIRKLLRTNNMRKQTMHELAEYDANVYAMAQPLYQQTRISYQESCKKNRQQAIVNLSRLASEGTIIEKRIIQQVLEYERSKEKNNEPSKEQDSPNPIYSNQWYVTESTPVTALQ